MGKKSIYQSMYRLWWCTDCHMSRQTSDSVEIVRSSMLDNLQYFSFLMTKPCASNMKILQRCPSLQSPTQKRIYVLKILAVPLTRDATHYKQKKAYDIFKVLCNEKCDVKNFQCIQTVFLFAVVFREVYLTHEWPIVCLPIAAISLYTMSTRSPVMCTNKVPNLCLYLAEAQCLWKMCWPRNRKHLKWVGSGSLEGWRSIFLLANAELIFSCCKGRNPPCNKPIEL